MELTKLMKFKEKFNNEEEINYIKFVYLGVKSELKNQEKIINHFPEYPEYKEKFERLTKPTIDKFIKELLGKSKEEFESNNMIKTIIDEVRPNQYTNNKKKFKELNDSLEEKGYKLEKRLDDDNPLIFCEWYLDQKDGCYYCGISQAKLKDLFEKGKISSKKPSFSATLQIEKKNPDKGYTAENCVLACCLCNNAKSDMISEKNYLKYFAKPMSEFLNDLFDKKIDNKLD